MEHDFWRARWAEQRIGFHEGRPNGLLQRHASRLGTSRRVLVPLSGKAVDLVWLAEQGHRVVGVELVEDAVRAFFDEQKLTPQRRAEGAFSVYSSGPLDVFVGDFFATTPEQLGEVNALYDRAALIALPASLRARYVNQVRTLLAPESPGLLIAVEYPQEQMEGPPFSVSAAEVAGYADCFSAELLEERAPDLPRLQALGVGVERCYATRRRGS